MAQMQKTAPASEGAGGGGATLAAMRDEPRFVINYMVGGADLWQDEHADIPPTVGQGLHFNGDFYRIVDVWVNHEKRAPVPLGVVAFLEQLDDVPEVYRAVNASYYA